MIKLIDTQKKTDILQFNDYLPFFCWQLLGCTKKKNCTLEHLNPCVLKLRILF